MHNKNLIQELSFGNISHRQAHNIVELLYEVVLSDSKSEISISDLEGHTQIQAFHNLAAQCPDGFEPRSIVFDGILDINSDNKDLWMLHAITTPFYFESGFQDYEGKEHKFPF